MEKMKMVFDNSLTFEEGCELYLDSCRIRNLREGTINHYKQSYTQFYKFFIISMRLKAHCRTEMMGLIGAGNNPMVGMTVAVAVAIEEASK